MIDIHDLLAFEFVHAAFLHADELDLGGVLAPVGGDQRKHVGKDAAVGRVGAAIADRDDWNLVGRALFDEGISDPRRQRVHHRRTRDALVLAALVALHAAGVVVLGLALLPGKFDAVNAAVALIDERHVVDPPGAEAGTRRGIGPHPVRIDRDELFLRLRLRPSGRQRQHRRRSRHTERPCRPFQNSLDHGKYLLKLINAA